MMRMISLISLLMLSAIAGSRYACSGAPQNSEPQQSAAAAKTQEQQAEAMLTKLKQAQTALEGLSVGDFKKLEDAAHELVVVNLELDAESGRTQEYRLHSSDFRRTAEALRDAAAKGNLDGATLAYVEMTVNCVKCHKYLRDFAKH